MAKRKKNKFADLGDGLTEGQVFNRPLREPGASELFTVPFAAPEDTELSLPDLPPEPARSSLHRLTHSQTFLLSGILLIATILGFTLLRVPRTQSTMASGEPNESVSTTASNGAETSEVLMAQLQDAGIDPVEEPLSLHMAESLYAQMAFEGAYHIYHQLHEELLKTTEDQDYLDFLMLRMGLCAKGLGQTDTQAQLLGRAAQSDSPVIRALTRYYQCLMALREGQFLNALTWAYQALALVDAVPSEAHWLGAFRRNCRFLICQATTVQALALQDSEGQVPELLWQMEPLPDPFQGLDNTALATFLAHGKEHYEEALLGPRIQMASGVNQGVVWQVACNGASIDEFLTRFGANANMDVNWSFDIESARETIDPTVRKRPVHMFLTEASAREIAELATGSVRLFVHVDPQGTMNVINPDPTICPSLSFCSKQWHRHARAVWQRLIWATDQDQYVPNAHFALGLLHEAIRRPSEAIAEYRLLADRFQRSKLAPHALLRASRIKTNMRDYLGARDDLKLLVDQYPDVAFSDEAVLYLAQATQKAGLYHDAYRLFVKVYNQAGISDHRVSATLGAGQCSFAMEQYDKAARWIVTHLDLGRDMESSAMHSARLFLGRVFSQLGQYSKAVEVFRDVLSNTTEKADYWDALRYFVQACIAQDKPVTALHTLVGTHPVTFGPDQENEIVIMKAQVFRSMGLMGKASALLNGHLRLIPERQQRALAYFELGSCATAMGDHHTARRCFSEVMVLSEPGPLALDATYELARTCLALDRQDKALSLCQQVLASNPPDDLRRKTLQLLSETHFRHERFEQAAKTLLEQLPPDFLNKSKTTSEPSAETLVSKNQ